MNMRTRRPILEELNPELSHSISVESAQLHLLGTTSTANLYL